MRINLSLGLAVGTLLLAGCSTSNQLSAAGERVTFVDQQPAANVSCWAMLPARRATG